MKTELYPLKFRPILKEKIWGGQKLQTVLQKETTTEQVGESWEISAVKGSVSVVKNGALAGQSLTQLLAVYKDKLVGKKVYAQYGEKFPLLFKFIDAKDNLSLQVHPDDVLAQKRHQSFGKTEMWYVMQADEGAGLYVGFKPGTTKQDYKDALAAETLQDLMNFEPVTSGSVFFIKPGLVHAIGKGVLLAEIQQSSDITYRVFDWNRRDKEGKQRELHTNLAVDAIDFQFEDYKVNYNQQAEGTTDLVINKYFKTRKYSLSKTEVINYEAEDSFVVLMNVKGEVEVKTTSGSVVLKKGETLLLPACTEKVELHTEGADILVVTV